MKGKLLISAALTTLLVGSNAFASLARLAVLGTQNSVTTSGTSAVVSPIVNGSLWYDDEYNVFYNPSYINDNKNYAVVQKGLEGGWFKSEFENFAYGVYFNRSTSTLAGTQGPGLTNKSVFNGLSNGVSTIRPIDLFFGGDTGIKWGAHLAWAYKRDQSIATSTDTEAEVSARYWHADLGAQIMGLEPFIGLTFSSKLQSSARNMNPAGTQNLDEFNVGTRYKYEGWTPYIAYKQYREGGTPSGGTTMLQTTVKQLGVGVGHDTKVADGVHIYKHLGFFYNSVFDDTVTSTTDVGRDTKQYVLPMNVNIEAEATSWLSLRAGVAYDFWNEMKHARVTPNNPSGTASGTDRKVSQAGTATARVGSTLKFGKLHVDSAFGNGTPTTGNATLDSQNMGFDSQLFALLSASYHW